MDYKNELQKLFSDEKKILESRYYSAKNIFIYSSLVFFLNYFFVGAKFQDNIFLNTIVYTYSIFVFSFCIYIYYYLKNTFDFKNGISIMISILLFGIFALFIFPYLKITF